MIKKKANKKGFTIMEMLIVVAIIAVLAAIAIPTFNGALTKSKEAADVANIRAAYAEAQVKIITEDVDLGSKAALVAAFTAPAKLNYKGTNHGYALDETNAKITYTPKKLNGGDAYTWTLGATDSTTGGNAQDNTQQGSGTGNESGNGGN